MHRNQKYKRRRLLRAMQYIEHVLAPPLTSSSLMTAWHETGRTSSKTVNFMYLPRPGRLPPDPTVQAAIDQLRDMPITHWPIQSSVADVVPDILKGATVTITDFKIIPTE